MSSPSQFLAPIIDIAAAFIAPELEPVLLGAETGSLGAALGSAAIAAGLGAGGNLVQDAVTGQSVNPLQLGENAAGAGLGGFAGAGGFGALGDALGIGGPITNASEAAAAVDPATNLIGTGASGAGTPAVTGAAAQGAITPGGSVVGAAGSAGDGSVAAFNAGGGTTGTVNGVPVTGDPHDIALNQALNGAVGPSPATAGGAANALPAAPGPNPLRALIKSLSPVLDAAGPVGTGLSLANIATQALGPNPAPAAPSPGASLGNPSYAQAPQQYGGLGEVYNPQTGTYTPGRAPQQTFEL
jgi:hypothetical protein